MSKPSNLKTQDGRGGAAPTPPNKYQLLEDLLDWERQWSSMHKEPFNWYGAVKAMLVMKEPQKPFTIMHIPTDKELKEELER